MDGVMQSDEDIKEKPASPKPMISEESSAILNINREPVETSKANSFQLSTLNGNSQVVVSAGKKILPIRGILLKPVNSAGTTTLISVPVSLTSNGTNLQSVSSTSVTVTEKEMPAVEKVLKPTETRGVSKVCLNTCNITHFTSPSLVNTKSIV